MDTQKVVVTGINGFVGRHLARELKANGYEVIGVGHDDVVASEIKDIVSQYYSADLTEEWPDLGSAAAIIHLAGLAAVGPSFDQPQLYINSNSAMVTHLGEYYLKQKAKPRILVVSSGSVYDTSQPMPINETSQLDFGSPYAVSKVLVENQCAYYKNRGLECIIIRPFNHIGPGQASGFIVPDFYKRIKDLPEDKTSIEVGNIETRRDYTDVRDIVSAYTKLAQVPKLLHSVYNVCSGKSLSGSEILDKLKTAMGRPEVTFEVNPSLVRPTDRPEIIGDSSRIRDELGWQPQHSIDQTIKDFVATQTDSTPK